MRSVRQKARSGLPWSVLGPRGWHLPRSLPNAVTLFVASGAIGGTIQPCPACIQGKEEFDEPLRYFGRIITLHGVDLRLGSQASADDLAAGGHDRIFITTGIISRMLAIEEINAPD